MISLLLLTEFGIIGFGTNKHLNKLFMLGSACQVG
jgi:hypothetical protein